VATENQIETILRETLSRLTTDEVNALRNRFGIRSDMNQDDEESALRALASEISMLKKKKR